jgi:microcompartment protein CcmL/EutN
MFLALIGTTVSALLLGRPHDQVLSALTERQGDHCVASR